MSKYYNPNRTRNLYPSTSSGQVPFRLSRGKIDNFISCPRCFYLDRKLEFDIKILPYTGDTSWVEGLEHSEKY